MSERIIDLRSDTVTQPCAAMLEVMMNAETGDDVYDEDPTVIELQAYLCAISGHESGLFFPSGTQSNLVALLTHCQRGDEYIVAQNAHTYKYEGGGAAALGGIQPQPLTRGVDGILDLNKIESSIKADDFHFAKTRLLALENTTTEGKVVPLNYLTDARALCDRFGLSLHLDGARVFNAAVAMQVEVRQITAMFDSVSICLSKGLGAPVGSVLCGSKDFIKRAKRWRKVVGGGMRQAGILAAAGLFALKNNVHRLADDHKLARYLCQQLERFEPIEIAYGGTQTNILFFYLRGDKRHNYDHMLEYAKRNGVLFGDRNPARMVVHKDLNQADIDLAIEKLSAFLS